MSENLFHAAMLAMFVALGACSAATHSPISAASAAVPVATASMPEPQPPFDTTPITPVESAGAAVTD